ncbi:hypothetical protein HY411_01860 [Candidatus Gottesmanbacteria bacterium]|nr:hypothetical protein [Candidatus Gottesmanbacteria bacterium]
MTATAHALVAGAIASSIPNTATASFLALGSHYIMDCIPHWDFGTNWRHRPKATTGMLAIADTLIAFTVAYILFAGKVGIVTVTIVTVASLLPDWLEAPWYIFFAHQKKHRPGSRAGALERLAFLVYKVPSAFHTKARFPLGLFTQIATVAFFWILLK